MADLVRVKFKKGGEGTVSREWVERWPDDIAAILDDDAQPATAPDLDELAVPPMNGRGSGADAWRGYGLAAAERAGITLDIPADAGRDDIVALLEGAGIPTTAPDATGDSSTDGTKEATK